MRPDVIVYVSDSEVEAFLQSSEQHIAGYCYEWEGENVVHLHTSALPHGFGKVSACWFTKDGSTQCTDADWVVTVKSFDDIEVAAFGKNSVQLCRIPSKTDLYSRSKGILEVGLLEDKCVTIIGLGSFGSQIAVELAKAGVGNFHIFDFDRVENHNLMRHTAKICDLGRLKTDVMEQSILGTNPAANVKKHNVDIAHEPEELERAVEECDLVICATDNNDSRFIISKMLENHLTPGIFGRALQRAEGGDVFIYRPGDACYGCMIGKFGTPLEEISSLEAGKANGQIPSYADNPEAMVQVGLSTDIAPICNMMEKLAIVELSRGCESGLSSLESEFVYNYYLWANRRDDHFRNWHSMPGAGAMPTVMRWYGAQISRMEGCGICTDSGIILDEGEDDELMLNLL